MMTSVMEAYEARDIMTADIPNTFLQTEMSMQDNDEKLKMKIRGPLVDMLVSLDIELYMLFVVSEVNKKVLYVLLIKAL